jgi:hypothetical protein
LGLIDIDIPVLWAALVAGTPAVTSVFELILEIEWRMISRDLYVIRARY